MSKLNVKLPGLNLKNPIMPASGTFGFGDVPQAKKYDLNEMGAMVFKTTTLHARIGNPQPQIAVMKNGVLNSVGLTNPGVDKVISDKIAPFKEQYPQLPLIASVGGSQISDYITIAKKLSDSGLLNALEINVSCPNVAAGGMYLGTDPVVVEKLTSEIKKVVNIPVYIKLTPNVTNIVEIAQAAERGGADGLSMINTLLGLGIDIKTHKATLGNGFGGWSGSAIKPVAVRMVAQVHQAVKLPIIGMGGIETAEDIVEFMLAGASAVAVGTAHFKDGLAIPHLVADLETLLNELKVDDINELIGQYKF